MLLCATKNSESPAGNSGEINDLTLATENLACLTYFPKSRAFSKPARLSSHAWQFVVSHLQNGN